MYIPKGTKITVKALHGGVALGTLATAYEPGDAVDLAEFSSPIPAKSVKAVTITEDRH